MIFQLKDIGVIDYASIECNSLTILTGKNGSGKSTISKAISSFYLALDNINQFFICDLHEYIVNFIFNSAGLERDYFSYIPAKLYSETKDYFDLFFALLQPIKRTFIFDSVFSARDYLSRVLHQLDKNKDRFVSLLSDYYYLSFPYFFNQNYRKSKKNNEMFEQNYLSIVHAIEELINQLHNEELLKRYFHTSIGAQLDDTFYGQLKPFNKSNFETSISITDNDFWVKYEASNSDNLTPQIKNIKTNCYYISDGNIIDDYTYGKTRRTKYSGLNKPYTTQLSRKLLNDLSVSNNKINAASLRNKYPDLYSQFDEVLPYGFIMDGNQIASNNGGIKIKNHASGTKVFAILKLLLESDKLNSNTLVLFDEPENHLHPEWQIIFSKILTLLNNYVGTKFLCVTHSPTMLFSLDVYFRKINKVKESPKVYFSEVINGRFNLLDCSNDITFAHKKLNDPYIFIDSDDDFDIDEE